MPFIMDIILYILKEHITIQMLASISLINNTPHILLKYNQSDCSKKEKYPKTIFQIQNLSNYKITIYISIH